jgi:hypothetical protein
MTGERQLRAILRDAGLTGSFLVRDLATGEEIGLDPDRDYPIASLVKIPLALAVLERVEDGRIDTRPWITHRCGFDALAETFPSYTKPETGVIKAMVELA